MTPAIRAPAIRMVAGILTILVVTGCAAQSGQPVPTPERRSPGEVVLPSPAAVAVPAEVLASLLADAAARSGADPATIKVLEGTSVTWSDGAWGCPQPGMLYTQALVDGWQVVVEAGGERIDYRAVAPDRFRICEGRPGT